MAQLSQPITYRTLLAFAVPMIVSQLFMNVNFIVDGFFVAHAVGTDGLSAINIVMPFIPLTIVLATMLGTGGSALVAAQLGAGENRHARENFSLLVLVCVILSTMMRLAGADGVAAIAISEYISGLLTGIYMGYAEGVAPLASFNYGKRDTHALRGILRRSLTLIAAFSLFTTALSLLIAAPITGIFAAAGTHVYDLAVHGFRIHATAFLFLGFSMYGSSFFTALGDGRTSALLSVWDTLVCLLGFLLLLPYIFGVDGVFMATPAADFLGASLTFLLLWRKRKQYGYW